MTNTCFFFCFQDTDLSLTCPSLINSVTQDSESERSSDLTDALGRLTVDMAIAAVSKFSVEKD